MYRIYNQDLRKARRWLASGRSTKVIHFLEPKVPLFIEDPQYYAILGRACVEAGLLKDADTYLNRGLQADPNHLEVRLSLAINHLKRKDPAAAVQTWLEILEEHPGEKFSSRGLKSLKRISTPYQQDRFLERFNSQRYLPFIGSRWPFHLLLLLSTILLLLLGFYFRDSISQFFQAGGSRGLRAGSQQLVPAKDSPLLGGGDALYPMDESEVERTLRTAIKHFEKYQDNLARLELNKIRYSNATDDIRQKAIGLIESLGEPSINSINTTFSFGEVNEQPRLYEGCWVLWRGRAANITYHDDAIEFDFLVGFENDQVLDGKVSVEVPFPVVMEPLPLELLAYVQPTESAFSLVAKTLHFLR